MDISGLKEVRKAVGLSSEKIGKEIGVNPGYVSRVELGKIKTPSFDIITKIAELIGNSEKVINNEVNLLDFNSDFAKFVVFVKNTNLEKQYEMNKNNDKLFYLKDSLEYIDSEEMSILINSGKYKKRNKTIDELKYDILEIGSNNRKQYKYNIQEKTTNIIEDGKSTIDYTKLIVDNSNELASIINKNIIGANNEDLDIEILQFFKVKLQNNEK